MSKCVKENADKIDWDVFSGNSSIFDLDYKKCHLTLNLKIDYICFMIIIQI